MAPGVVYFLLFHYGAMAGNVIAFKDYVPFDGLWASQWVGLANFRAMFATAAIFFCRMWFTLLIGSEIKGWAWTRARCQKGREHREMRIHVAD